MPVVGFIDAAGERVTFEAIRAGAGTFAGLPRPFVRALAGGYRAADHYGDTSVVSVTTLINPVQQTRLIQRHELYVEPFAIMWALFGTLGHALLEAGVDPESDDTVAERRLVIERDGQLIGGTFDLLELESGEWVGRDYKVTGAYGVAKMAAGERVYDAKRDYFWQANMYRTMIADPTVREVVPAKTKGGKPKLVPFAHAGLEVSRWQLVAWSRDWTAAKYAGHLRPVELINVPLLAPERVENYMRQRLAVYAASAMCDDAGLPRCTSDETWSGRRCAQWCAAAPVCSQLKGRRR